MSSIAKYPNLFLHSTRTQTILRHPRGHADQPPVVVCMALTLHTHSLTRTHALTHAYTHLLYEESIVHDAYR